MGGGDSRESASRWGAGVSLLLALGCASSAFVTDASGFLHRSAGFYVASPALLEPAWRRVDVEGKAISFQGPRGAIMSLQSSCRPRRASPRLLAQHLQIGLPERAQRDSRAVRAGTLEGWSRTFDVRGPSGVVRVRTVTAVYGDCVLDWVLTGDASFEAAQPLFDTWWGSFESEPNGGEAW